MTLPVTRWVTLRGVPTVRPAVVVTLPMQTEAICRACPWLGPQDRCCHPRHGCTSGGHRIRPWAFPRPCPEAPKISAKSV